MLWGFKPRNRTTHETCLTSFGSLGVFVLDKVEESGRKEDEEKEEVLSGTFEIPFGIFHLEEVVFRSVFGPL